MDADACKIIDQEDTCNKSIFCEWDVPYQGDAGCKVKCESMKTLKNCEKYGAGMCGWTVEGDHSVCKACANKEWDSCNGLDGHASCCDTGLVCSADQAGWK